VERALRAAHEAHLGQTRKGGDVPYVLHPLHAAIMLARLGADDLALQAAILHDVVEDSDDWTIERVSAEFGPAVGSIVAEVTEDKSQSWEQRKRHQVEHVPHLSERARLVKAADKLHNLSSLLADLQAAADPNDVWRHFSRGPAATLAMARDLVEALAPHVDPRLALPLRAVLGQLEALARP